MKKITLPKRWAFVPIDEVTERTIYDTYKYCNVGGKLRVVRQVPSVEDEEGNALTLEFMTPEEFKKAFINKVRAVKVTMPTDKPDPLAPRAVTTKIIKRTLAEMFLTNSKRKTYDRLVFQADPARVKPTDLNMWNGFALAPEKGDWSSNAPDDFGVARGGRLGIVSVYYQMVRVGGSESDTARRSRASSLLKNLSPGRGLDDLLYHLESPETIMRGAFMDHGGLFSYIAPDKRAPPNHPLRKIRELVRDVLSDLNRSLGKLYASEGRPSIPPELLLSALLLQVFYGIRSERQLMEQLDYNLLYPPVRGAGAGRPGLGPDHLHQEPGAAAERRSIGEVHDQATEPSAGQAAAVGRALLGGWNADRSLGFTEELSPQGRQRRR